MGSESSESSESSEMNWSEQQPTLADTFNRLRVNTLLLTSAYKEAFSRLDLDGNGEVARTEVKALGENPGQTRLRPEFVQAVSQHFDLIATADGDEQAISEIDFAIVSDIYQTKQEGDLVGKGARDFMLRTWGSMPKEFGTVHSRQLGRALHRVARNHDEHVYADYLESIFPAMAGSRRSSEEDGMLGDLFLLLSKEEASVSPERANELALHRKYGDGKVLPEVFREERLPQILDFVGKTREMLN